jgi:hypothetical protein
MSDKKEPSPQVALQQLFNCAINDRRLCPADYLELQKVANIIEKELQEVSMLKDTILKLREKVD